MPVATLTYTLPDEVEEFRRANEGGALAAAVHDFDQRLRERAKYGDDSLTASEARRWLAEELESRGVSTN